MTDANQLAICLFNVEFLIRVQIRYSFFVLFLCQKKKLPFFENLYLKEEILIN